MRRHAWRRITMLAVPALLGAGLWLGTPQRRPGPAPAAAEVEGSDCNENGADDVADIEDGTSLDCDGDGVPDECQADGSSDLLTATRIASGLTYAVTIEPSRHDADHLLVGLKNGRIVVVDVPTGAVLVPPLLDISDRVTTAGERGLLGVALDPYDATHAWIYVAYSEKATGDLRLSRFPLGSQGTNADADGEEVLLSVDPPTTSHNGGQLRFGPDGKLYLSVGDGTNYVQNDPLNNAQNGQSLLGKLLRLDPSAPPEFVPDDNPFVDDPKVRDLIWASGFRNPWRFTFDRLTGDVYIGDVGLYDREEIDAVPAGAGGRNFGWRCLEGTLCTGLEGPCVCDDGGLHGPAHEVVRSTGCWALIGGFVYRGCRIPALHGRYVFANYCDGAIYSVRTSRDGSGEILLDDEREHTDAVNPQHATLVTTFGEDLDGELYYATIMGALWRIDAAPDCNGNGAPDAADIAAGTSRDCDANGVPDECDPDGDGNGTPDACDVAGDVDGDGDVDVDDLLGVITAWGACPDGPSAPCPADVDGDGLVGIDDLILVILGWT